MVDLSNILDGILKTNSELHKLNLSQIRVSEDNKKSTKNIQKAFQDIQKYLESNIVDKVNEQLTNINAKQDKINELLNNKINNSSRLIVTEISKSLDGLGKNQSKLFNSNLNSTKNITNNLNDLLFFLKDELPELKSGQENVKDDTWSNIKKGLSKWRVSLDNKIQDKLLGGLSLDPKLLALLALGYAAYNLYTELRDDLDEIRRNIGGELASENLSNNSQLSQLGNESSSQAYDFMKQRAEQGAYDEYSTEQLKVKMVDLKISKLNKNWDSYYQGIYRSSTTDINKPEFQPIIQAHVSKFIEQYLNVKMSGDDANNWWEWHLDKAIDALYDTLRNGFIDQMKNSSVFKKELKLIFEAVKKQVDKEWGVSNLGSRDNISDEIRRNTVGYIKKGDIVNFNNIKNKMGDFKLNVDEYVLNKNPLYKAMLISFKAWIENLWDMYMTLGSSPSVRLKAAEDKFQAFFLRLSISFSGKITGDKQAFLDGITPTINSNWLEVKAKLSEFESKTRDMQEVETNVSKTALTMISETMKMNEANFTPTQQIKSKIKNEISDSDFEVMYKRNKINDSTSQNTFKRNMNSILESFNEFLNYLLEMWDSLPDYETLQNKWKEEYQIWRKNQMDSSSRTEDDMKYFDNKFNEFLFEANKYKDKKQVEFNFETNAMDKLINSQINNQYEFNDDIKSKKEELDEKSKELDPNSTLNKSWLDKLKEKINTMGGSSGNANTNNSTSSRGERTGWSKWFGGGKWFGGDNIDYNTNIKYGNMTTKLRDKMRNLKVNNINVQTNQKIVAKKINNTSNQKVINNNFSDRKIISNTNIITYGETVI